VDVGLLAGFEDSEVLLDGAKVGDDPVGSGLRTVGGAVPAGPALTLWWPARVSVYGEVVGLAGNVEGQENSKVGTTWAVTPGTAMDMSTSLGWVPRGSVATHPRVACRGPGSQRVFEGSVT
jgi:hypothetical protein